jgi:hypothetical protein
MNHQNFHNTVGQVAGGNINNYGVNDLTILTRQEVETLRLHLIERLADARKRILYNPIVGWMVTGAIIMFIEIFTGLAMQHAWALFVTLLTGLLLPYFFFIPIQRKYGPLVHAYRDHIQYIETYQHSRSWI